MNNSIPFYHTKHVEYIKTLASKVDKKDSYEGAVTEHLRMSGVYWSLTGLSLLLPTHQVDTLMNLTTNHNHHHHNNNNIDGNPSIVDFVFSCHDEKSGGFGGNVNQDGHILYTLSAIQILALAQRLDDDRFLAMKKSVIRFIQSLQQEDGSFCGDEWGEIDTRFSYCALSALSIIGALRSGVVDVDKAADYIASCQNFDGGFGCQPGAESHAGQIFCCVGALSIAQRLDVLKDEELLCWWLCERQCDSGGLNGRPEKQADVCYSWWILSSLCILGKLDWISGQKLANFILKCQDDDDGGIADRPGDMADVFHTFFGIAGLSLIGYLHNADMNVDCDEIQQYRKIDPVYALPTDVVKGLGLKGQIVKNENQKTNDRLSHYDVYNYT